MSANPLIDPAILSRYDRPAPRYTSYPPVPRFTTAFGAAQFRRFAQSRNASNGSQALSLYVHVPFCRSPCLYCGCNRIITRSTQMAADYHARLLDEIDLLAPLFGHREVAQLHFGGGTPNFF